MSFVESVVIAGSVAQRPGIGGHTWQFLQYILGFRRLGWKVLFVDRLDPGMCTDTLGRPTSPEHSIQLAYFRSVMAGFGLSEDCALFYDGAVIEGLPREQVKQRIGESAFLLNVMGFFEDPELLAEARLRVFLDTDPGYAQIWRALGLADMFHSHDRYVTIAENIGRSDCLIPTCGIDWLTWRQPVVLEQWPHCAPVPGAAFTAIGAWRGPYDRLEYGGHSYGQRAHEFRKYFTLPRRSNARFDVALDIDASDVVDIQALKDHGWNLVPPSSVSATPGDYRAFIQSSRAEFMIARGMYTQARCGWFSERSACYLATGRPVLASDTGLDSLLPLGEGLITFSTLEEALEGVDTIESNYDHHASRARELAEAYFDSDTVLLNLADRVTATGTAARRSP